MNEMTIPKPVTERHDVPAPFNSPTLTKIIQSLVKAHKMFGPILKETKGFNYKYADLSNVLAAVRGPLAENGIIVCQNIIGAKGDRTVVTTLYHTSGEFMSFHYPIVEMPDGRSKLSPPQNYGASVTYSRRYGLQNALMLASEDDDAEARQKKKSWKEDSAKQKYKNPDRNERTQDERLADFGLTPKDMNPWIKMNTGLPAWEKMKVSDRERLIDELKDGVLMIEHVKEAATIKPVAKKVLKKGPAAPLAGTIDDEIKRLMSARKKLKPEEKDPHHKSFKPAHFAMSLKDAGFEVNSISAWCEANHWGRPSGWEGSRRLSFVEKLKKGELTPPDMCRVKK